MSRLIVVLCALFVALMLFDAGRDAFTYYKQYSEWKHNAGPEQPAPKIGSPTLPGFPPIHRTDDLNFPLWINGLKTVRGRYVMQTDGTGAKPDEYMHVDAVATASDFDIVALDDDDIPTKAPGGEADFLLTPKRDGFLGLSVRAKTYRIDPRTNKQIGEGFRSVANLTVLVDEPLLSVPWFEAHPFAKDLFFAVLPLFLGFVAGRLSTQNLAAPAEGPISNGRGHHEPDSH
ncbi:MAG TPA: hypothetical protein VGZ02_10520 [Candidatus Baltobacteraceae bacterium]|nr:hypothetical protein [Candidatus Baltobacteraceae bacterium]